VRPNQIKEKLKKCQKIYYDTKDFCLYNLIPMMWDRETAKQTTERLEDAKFEKQYEEMMKKKSLKLSETSEKIISRALPERYFEPKVFEEHNRHNI
jgi:hypothetical protein